MFWTLCKQNKPAIGALLFLIALILVPTGFEDALIYKGMERSKGTIVETDNSRIYSNGLIQSGEQVCKVKLLNGNFAGQTVEGINLLTGSLSEDKMFQEGDKALVMISHNQGQVLSASLVDHFRLDNTFLLAILFVVFLILFAGKIGVHSVLSFFIAILSIWKVLVPCILKGYNPVFAGMAMILALTFVIITLVYGFDRRSASAILGAGLGVVTTAILGILFTDLFRIHGAVMAYSETLLYNGYLHLNLTQIFMASIFIGASGAVMDLAVDITSSVHEVVRKKPDISWQEAALSGVRVGRAAVGTMSTTLLLAYSGGYLALMMVFMAQGTPIDNILNYKYISAEILHTIVGSFGLVTVAPFTALASGILLTKKRTAILVCSEAESLE